MHWPVIVSEMSAFDVRSCGSHAFPFAFQTFYVAHSFMSSSRVIHGKGNVPSHTIYFRVYRFGFASMAGAHSFRRSSSVCAVRLSRIEIALWRNNEHCEHRKAFKMARKMKSKKDERQKKTGS